MVFMSLMTLRPLCRCPRGTGTWPAAGWWRRAVRPGRTIWLVLAASASVAGPTAAMMSVMAGFFASSRSASRGCFGQRRIDLPGPGVEFPQQLIGQADQVAECLALVAGRLTGSR